LFTAYDVATPPDEETRKNITDPQMAYAVSKILAHVAAGEYVEEHKVNYDLVRVLPGYVQGANELYTSAADMRDPAKVGSNEGVMGTALGWTKGQPRITGQVLLEDVAKAHVLALKPEVAKHGDHLFCAGNDGKSTPWSEWATKIEQKYPDAVKKGILKPKINDPDWIINGDVSGTEKALGFKFAGTDEMLANVIDQYISLASSE